MLNTSTKDTKRHLLATLPPLLPPHVDDKPASLLVEGVRPVGTDSFLEQQVVLPFSQVARWFKVVINLQVKTRRKMFSSAEREPARSLPQWRHQPQSGPELPNSALGPTSDT